MVFVALLERHAATLSLARIEELVEIFERATKVSAFPMLAMG